MWANRRLQSALDSIHRPLTDNSPTPHPEVPTPVILPGGVPAPTTMGTQGDSHASPQWTRAVSRRQFDTNASTGTGRMVPRQNDSEAKRNAYSDWKWPAVLTRKEGGDHPTAQQLIDLVEYCGVSAAARGYLAARMRSWTGCGGGDVIHGESGRPTTLVLERVREWLRLRELQKRIDRRRDRCARVRLTRPRNKDLHPSVIRRRTARCAHNTLYLGSPCPECGTIRVLTDARNLPDGWAHTKNGLWKIKQPSKYSLRRVALEEGISSALLRRRIRAWREKGNKSLIQLLENERADVTG